MKEPDRPTSEAQDVGRRVDRRAFLRTTSVAAATMGASWLQWPPLAWGRSSGSSATTRVVSGTRSRSGFRVGPGERLVFDPYRSTTLEVSGNLIVEGILEMRPASRKVVHTLRFVDVDESTFVGGGMEVLPTDVGLWVMGGGRLRLAGTPVAAWNRSGTSSTWRLSDELVLTPTELEDSTGFRSFRKGEHVPQVDGRWKGEVLNLTRNVRIMGTPSGRSHIFIHSHHDQMIKNVAISHMGPRKGGDFVLGRYGLHFHHCENGSRGSTVHGVVVRDCGSHSFVPHLSHGITYRSCIAYNVTEDAYWWDEGDLTHDIVFDRCVAALVKTEVGSPSQYTVTGFNLQDGNGNIARNCVAVGVQGRRTSSGFLWPSKGPEFGVWTFTGCRAHNNAYDGIYAWQNDEHAHVISDYVSYRNGKAGIEHGAYTNRYLYERCHHFQDGWLVDADPGAAALLLHAVSAASAETSLTFRDSTMDGGGVTPAAIELVRRTADAQEPTQFVRCHLTGFTDAAVIVDDDLRARGLHDLVRCPVGPERRDLEPEDFKVVSMAAGSEIRVQRMDGTAFKIVAPGVAQPTTPFA